MPEKNSLSITAIVLSSLVHLSSNNHQLQLVFNTQQKKSSPVLKPRGCDLCYRSVLAETVLVLFVFYYHVFPRYRKYLYRNSNPGQFLRVVAFVPVISTLKQTTLVLAPFFYRA
jgi:hypothetical protein